VPWEKYKTENPNLFFSPDGSDPQYRSISLLPARPCGPTRQRLTSSPSPHWARLPRSPSTRGTRALLTQRACESQASLARQHSDKSHPDRGLLLHAPQPARSPVPLHSALAATLVPRPSLAEPILALSGERISNATTTSIQGRPPCEPTGVFLGCHPPRLLDEPHFLHWTSSKCPKNLPCVFPFGSIAAQSSAPADNVYSSTPCACSTSRAPNRGCLNGPQPSSRMGSLNTISLSTMCVRGHLSLPALFLCPSPYSRLECTVMELVLYCWSL
jgi:hypothetical protein